MVHGEQLRGDAQRDLLRRLAADVEADGAADAIERLPGDAARLEPVTEAAPLGLAADEAHVARRASHDVDEAIVGDVVTRPARYLGLIGSETKWRRFRDRLEARGVAREALDRVKCPIGLDIGGKSPPEVAVSIAAELLSVHHGRASR